jgi:hypothetical protein
MKLFVIVERKTNKVKAISESKKDTVNYMITKGFNEKEYFFIKIKKEKHINELLLQYEDLYLEHDEYLDMVLTRAELSLVDEIIAEERSRIESVLNELGHMIKNYHMSSKEKDKLNKAYKILHSIKKKKRLKSVIGVDKFLGFVKRSRNIAELFKDKLNETKEKMFIFINLKD